MFLILENSFFFWINKYNYDSFLTELKNFFFSKFKFKIKNKISGIIIRMVLNTFYKEKLYIY